MYKIKLLILLLISTILLSCSSNHQTNQNHNAFSVDYIDGGFDGLQLKNYLISYLDSYKMYDPQSTLSIKGNIAHSSSVYITNINNTSDRNKITSQLNIQIYHNDQKCLLYSFNQSSSQFFIISSSKNYLSNNSAEAKIKNDNLNYLIKKFINEIKTISLSCPDA